MDNEGSAAVTCNSCGMFLFLPTEVENFTCTKCKLVALLEEKVQQLESRVATLQHIREQEDFLDTIELTILDEYHAEEDARVEEVTSHTQEADSWRNVTKRSKPRRDCSGSLQLENRFEALSLIKEDEEEQHGQTSGTEQGSLRVPPEGTVAAKPRRRRVVVVGDSLLRGTEAVICRPDKMSREVCCLPGAKIRDVTERLTRLVKPTDQYPFLLVHVGTNDTARHSLQNIKRDYEALGRKLKGMDVQVVISSLLPVEGHGPGRERKIADVNNWLRRWCRREGFGFFDHGLRFHEEGLLATDGLHLTQVGRNVFANSLKNLIRRALN